MVREMSIFLLLGWVLPSSTSSSIARTGQSIYDGGNRQDKRRRNILGRMGDTGDIIQGHNSAGHCFVLKYLIPKKFFK